jgi:hypothetical protein
MSTVGGGVNIITDGLVLYLDAANTKSIVSGSTTWNDLSRSGNNGTLVNGPTFNSGNGGSIVFDGLDDYMITTTIQNYRSMCIWVKKLATAPSVWKYLIDLRPNGSAYIATNAIAGWQIFRVNNVNTAISWASLPTDTWFHLYLQTNNNLNSTINFMSRFSNNETLPGNISQVQIYNRALTTQEILQNYNATKGRFGL